LIHERAAIASAIGLLPVAGADPIRSLATANGVASLVFGILTLRYRGGGAISLR
jgi:hypothetical protein